MVGPSRAEGEIQFTSSVWTLLLAVPRRLFCFGSLVVLDMVFRYLSLFLLYINTKIGKNRCLMLDSPVATCMGNSCSPGCRGWCLLMASFCAVLFPLDVLDEILDVIESVSEGFLTYSFN